MRTLEGVSLFFCFFMLLVFALYLMGNMQNFLDRSQHMLLELLEYLALLCAFSTLYYLVMLTIWMIRRRFFVLPRLVYSVCAIVLGGALAFGSSFLSALFLPAG